jgi:predicted lipoprotein with Yx(FWY)xxD motif
MSQTAAPLVLTDEDRAELVRWSQGRRAMLAERARIVLACAEPGSGVARVAAEPGSTRMTVRVLKTATINGATVLTNGKGLTLYWFAPDTAARSVCTGACAQ